MSREKQIEEMAKEIEVFAFCDGSIDDYKMASKLYRKGYRKQSEVIKEFVKRFEKHIGNCTFTLGQFNDIQYALRKATEEMKGGE